LRARGFRRHDLSIKLQMLGLNQAANISTKAQPESIQQCHIDVFSF
jgi:hypothetical protein